MAELEDLFSELRSLESRAQDQRRKDGDRYSRREVAREVRHKFGVDLGNGKRISDWLPRDPNAARIPREWETVWALVKVWSEWADEQEPDRDWWIRLVEAAQPGSRRTASGCRRTDDGMGNRALAQDANMSRFKVAAGYRNMIREIAPDALLDRVNEIGRIQEFCTLDQQYAWWQAGPWAGKTALLSWVAVNPPANVDVISFFASGRFLGQSNSDAFLDIILEQIAALVGEPVPTTGRQSRQGQMLRLFDEYASMARRGQRTMLLIVDGLDEDTDIGLGSCPSIASMLPRYPPSEMKIMVASRPSLGLPDDVIHDHPLRMTMPWILTPSPHARIIELAAKNEIAAALGGLPLQRDVLGLITAASGGLTLDDLEELTGHARYELENILSGPLGRTLSNFEGDSTAATPTPRAIIFAHETLASLAVAQYGRALLHYHERIHTWARVYQVREWPPESPVYVLQGYFEMLKTTGDLESMIRCASDQSRHTRLFERTGGAEAALAEVRTCETALLNQQLPDVGTLLLLANRRDELTAVGDSIPFGLARLWMKFNYAKQGEALARGCINPHSPGRGLGMLASVFAADNRIDDAITIIESIDEPQWRARALMAALRDAVRGGDDADIRKIVAALTLLGDVSRGIAPGFLADMARLVPEQIGREISSTLMAKAIEITNRVHMPILSYLPYQTIGIATIWAIQGDAERAITFIRRANTDEERAVGLAEIATRLSASSEHELARILVPEALEAAASLSREDRDGAMLPIIAAMASLGEFNNATNLARDIADINMRADALTEVAEAAEELGHRQVAYSVASEASRVAHSKQPNRQVEVLSAAAAAGVHARIPADILSELIKMAVEVSTIFLPTSQRGSSERSNALHRLVQISCTFGDTELARTILPHISPVFERDRAARDLVTRLIADGDYELALKITRSMKGIWLVTALTCLAAYCISRADYEGAKALAVEASELAQSADILRSWGPDSLLNLADVYIQLGEPDRANEYFASLDPVTMGDAWVRSGRNRMAVYAAKAQKFDLAKTYLRNPDKGWLLDGLTEVATIARDSGDAELAESLFKTAEAAAVRSRNMSALMDIARRFVDAGDYARFEDTIDMIDATESTDAIRAEVARLLAIAGNPRRALGMLADISDTEESFSAHLYIARAFSAQDLLHEARMTLASAEPLAINLACVVRYIGSSEDALARLAEEYARMGDALSAMRILRGIKDEKRAAIACGSAAISLTEIGDQVSASRLFAEALTKNSWLQCLEAVSKCMPYTIDALIHVIVSG